MCSSVVWLKEVFVKFYCFITVSNAPFILLKLLLNRCSIRIDFWIFEIYKTLCIILLCFLIILWPECFVPFIFLHFACHSLLWFCKSKVFDEFIRIEDFVFSAFLICDNLFIFILLIEKLIQVLSFLFKCLLTNFIVRLPAWGINRLEFLLDFPS